MTILFVCSGNTCRSPLAVAAWQALNQSIDGGGQESSGADANLASQNLDCTEVESAGLAAWHGQKASGHTVEVARSWGIDLKGHRARGLSTHLLRRADLVVTMTEDQAAAVRAHFGLPEGKVVPLGYFDEKSSSLHEEKVQQRLTDMMGSEEGEGELWRGPVHIADPYGGSLEAYESCAQQIRRAVKGLQRALREGEIVW